MLEENGVGNLTNAISLFVVNEGSVVSVIGLPPGNRFGGSPDHHNDPGENGNQGILKNMLEQHS